jgi:invasion protein IalB
VRTPLGAKVYFLPTMNVLGAGFREEKAIERARMKGDGTLPPAKPTRPVLEGGLEVCVDDVPCARVRVRRIAMEEGTVVKAMSEKELLESLRAEIDAVEKLAAAGKRVTGGTPPQSSSP